MSKKGEFSQYFEYIRYAMNPAQLKPPSLDDFNWMGFYRFVCEQAISGVAYEGVLRQEKSEIRPPFDVLLEWVVTADQMIPAQNRQLNNKCVEVLKELQDAGFQCCIMKGQGNAISYPNPLSRNPGDIDVLIMNANRKELLEFARERCNGELECRFHHIEYDEDGICIELHTIPCSMNNPLYNSRLQKWFAECADKENIWDNNVALPDTVGTITAPTVVYNTVYQLAHMMHHFFDEGIGLRQMMDYYYVLKSRTNSTGITDTLKYLGLWKFAGAVMYVMREVFALEGKYMIAPVDERRGNTLMVEILKGGNFGQYSGLTDHSTSGKYFAKTLRNLCFVREYPTEALCEPVFRTWHFFWRLVHKKFS